MKGFVLLLLLGIIIAIPNFSCHCRNPKILHLDFCDFLNDVRNEKEKANPQKIVQEKDLNFVIDETDTKCLSDSMIRNFIKNDEFIQREIQNGYYRLDITFYKKSGYTDALIKKKSSRYIDYCENDIVFEYQWVEGKFYGVYYYDKGIIKGTEQIKLEIIKKK